MAAKHVDYTGHVEGNLKVLELVTGKTKWSSRNFVWLCECLKCGDKFEATSSQLRGEKRKEKRSKPRSSCGKCDRSERANPLRGPDHPNWGKPFPMNQGEKNHSWKGGWNGTRLQKIFIHANGHAKKRGDDNRLVIEDIVKMWTQQKQQCWYCGCKLSLELQQPDTVEGEHKIPTNKVSQGKNVVENVVLACHECNQEKKVRTAEEYLEFRLSNDLDINEERVYAA